MSLDRSLKSSGNLSQHRNVLSRPERIAKLKEAGRFDSAKSDPIHLPKVSNRKVVTKKEAKVKGEGEGEAGAAAPAAPAAGGAKAGGGAKPSGGAKK